MSQNAHYTYPKRPKRKLVRCRECGDSMSRRKVPGILVYDCDSKHCKAVYLPGITTGEPT